MLSCNYISNQRFVFKFNRVFISPLHIILLSTLSHHCKVFLETSLVGLLKEILSKSLDLFCSSCKYNLILCIDDLIRYRMTWMNFCFPYADQFVERYAKTTTEFIQFALCHGSCKSSQVIVALFLLRIEKQVSTK